jgi:release factor glutamine methyltransferase
MASIRDLILQSADQLRACGVDTPEHDAKLLLAEAAGVELRDVDKAMLMGDGLGGLIRIAQQARVAQSPEPPRMTRPVQAFETSRSAQPPKLAQPPEASRSAAMAVESEFQKMLSRRAGREPLQYITGHTAFRYLDLKVGPGVFIPRPETETVVQAGLDWIARHDLHNPRMVDLCAGSGAIGLSVATEVPGSQVWAVELSARTAEWTRKNLDETAKRYPSIASNYQLEIGDATSMATLAHLDGTVDMVITNPPYVPQDNIPEQSEVRDWDPELALYGGSPDGVLIPERIIERAFRLLKPSGVLVMEHDISQGDRLVAYAKASGFTSAVTGLDWTGRDRYLFAER